MNGQHQLPEGNKGALEPPLCFRVDQWGAPALYVRSASSIDKRLWRLSAPFFSSRATTKGPK